MTDASAVNRARVALSGLSQEQIAQTIMQAMGLTLIIPAGMVEQIEREAIVKAPHEACGLIGGHDTVLTALAPCSNHAADPNSAFFIEPFNQFTATQALEAAGHDVIGLYHSHPVSEAQPSKADLESLPESLFSLIYSVSYGELRAWSGEKEIDLEVVPNEQMPDYAQVAVSEDE